jgi:hypothetical protein
VITSVHMPRSNVSPCIFGHENCANIVSLHNNQQTHFNMQIFQKILDRLDPFYNFRDGNIFELSAYKCDASLSLGTPTNWYINQVKNESIDTNSCFWVSCLITLTEFLITVHFIFNFRINFQSNNHLC